jgi:hypothetical protein
VLHCVSLSNKRFVGSLIIKRQLIRAVQCSCTVPWAVRLR